MHTLTANDLASVLSPSAVVEALKQMFILGAEVPLRHHHTIKTRQGNGTLLIMPAWSAHDASTAYAGVKLVNVYPENPTNGLPSIQGSYFLFDKSSGTPLATMDGSALTLFRTAAASALAATYLAPENARCLLMVGTGRLAPYIIRAYTEVLGIQEVLIWGRTSEKAEALSLTFENASFAVTHVANLEGAMKQADVVSCATMSTAPLLYGEWLSPGQHIDLIGSFTPQMRETDDAVIQRSAVFVDTREGALSEAGDLIQPLQKGLFTPENIIADLSDLCRGVHPGRTDQKEITLFKSVGTSLEDLAIAKLAFELVNTDLKS